MTTALQTCSTHWALEAARASTALGADTRRAGAGIRIIDRQGRVRGRLVESAAADGARTIAQRYRHETHAFVTLGSFCRPADAVAALLA